MLDLLRTKGMKLTLLLGFLSLMACGQMVQVGAEQVNRYLPLLYKKKVAVVANPTSVIDGTHLVDSLLGMNVEVVKVFALEHGFRGKADAGEKVMDDRDEKTGLPIVSLYGSHRTPTAADLSDVDIVLFDVQDVGARFYTYISSMTYIMGACAENDVAMIVLDRPNPNGHYFDGPMNHLDKPSFIGLHDIPVVHGLTIGEYAQMVKGEGWMNTNKDLDLTVVPCANYDHNTRYTLPVDPSPNLRSMEAIYLYPSLCFFEGTNVSIGRGTDMPFEVVGAPWMTQGRTTFTPKSGFGAASPRFQNIECRGYNVAQFGAEFLGDRDEINLFWLLDAYSQCPDKDSFFERPDFFDTLAGGPQLREQIMAGKSEEEIRRAWRPELQAFGVLRAKYLLYPDFD